MKLGHWTDVARFEPGEKRHDSEWGGKRDMPITLLDGILVGFTLVSAMLAMVRGFSREILSRRLLGGGSGGGLLLLQAGPALSPALHRQ